MNKSDFLKYLNNADEDNEGNLYFINDYGKKTYFCTIETICADLIEEYCCKEEDGYELYDRHFWNDDTLICQIVREAKPKTVTHFNELFKKQEYIDLLNKHGLTVEKFNELRVDFNKLYKGGKNETN